MKFTLVGRVLSSAEFITDLPAGNTLYSFLCCSHKIVSVNSRHERLRPRFPMGVAGNLCNWLGVAVALVLWTSRCALTRLFPVISGSLGTKLLSILPLRTCIFRRRVG